jgi:putative peptide modification system cyclase
MSDAQSQPDARTPTSTPAVTPLLRTVLLCDLADSTALLERLGDVRASSLFQRHDRLLLELLEATHGRLIDKADGILALFERPVQAVDFALRYQRALHVLGVEVGQTLLARVGIHVGDVMTWQNDAHAVQSGAKPMEVEGLAKPVAARLMALALPGQILLSGMAQSLAQRAQGELGEAADKVRWLVHGRYRFKGVPAPMIVHEVGEPGHAQLRQPPSGQKSWREVPLWRRPPVLALELLVLAAIAGLSLWSTLKSEPALAFSERDWVVVGDLQNHTPEKLFDQSLDTAFRAGLEQSRYVNVLSDLQVREGLVRMQRKDQPVDRQIGIELALREGARALVLPAVAEVGGRIRVSAEIVNPATGVTVFTETADSKTPASVLAALDEVLQKLRAQLGESLASIDKNGQPLQQVTTGNLEALKAYSLAIDALANRDPQTTFALLQRAVELDPHFAAAHAKLGAFYIQSDDLAKSRGYMIKAWEQRDRLGPRDRLYVEAQLATFQTPQHMLDRWSQLAALYPDFMTGQQNLALVHWWHENQFAQAEALFAQVAGSRHPLRGLAMQGQAIMLNAQGRSEEALRVHSEVEAAGATNLYDSKADVYLAQRDYARAESAFTQDRTRDNALQTAWKGIRRAAWLADQGKTRAALDVIDQLDAAPLVSPAPVNTARLDLARLAILSRSDPAAMKALLARYVAEQKPRVAAWQATYDASSISHLLLAGLIAARNGEAALAQQALDATREHSLESGYYEREVLWRALHAELALAKGDLPTARADLSGLSDKRAFFQGKVTRLRVLRALRDPAAESFASELCGGRGQALSEWVFGFSALVPNLMDANDACLATIELGLARGNRAGVEPLERQLAQAWAGSDANWDGRQALKRLATRPGLLDEEPDHSQ